MTDEDRIKHERKKQIIQETKKLTEEIKKLAEELNTLFPGTGVMFLKTLVEERPGYKTSLDELRKLQDTLEINMNFQEFKRRILEEFPAAKLYRTSKERGIRGIKILGTD